MSLKAAIRRAMDSGQVECFADIVIHPHQRGAENFITIEIHGDRKIRWVSSWSKELLIKVSDRAQENRYAILDDGEVLSVSVTEQEQESYRRLEDVFDGTLLQVIKDLHDLHFHNF